MKFNKLFFKTYNDIFFTERKIRKINNGYRLYFNEKNKKFYIVNICRNYEICYEFNNFFNNIENNLRFSNICNINKILKQIEDDNQNLKDKTINYNVKKTGDIIKEQLYLNNRLKTIN